MPLTLAKETMDMNWRETAASGSSQLLLEGDLIVPDSKPDLQELLRCQGTVRLREKRVTDDRISFSGELELSVLYRAKNGARPLSAMQAALPLEDFLHIDGLEREQAVTLTADLEHLDCEIINDRKIGVKAVLSVRAVGERQNHAEILSGVSGEGMECLQGKLRMEQEIATLKDRFPIKEELSLPAAKPEIAEILWQTADLTEQELRAMDGKVLVRGNLRICMLYCDGEGHLGSFCDKLAFSGYLEGERIEPKTELSGTLQLEEARLTPTIDADGEARQLAVDASVHAALQGREIIEQEILQDAYAPTGTVALEKERISYPITVGSGKNQFVLKERLQLEAGEKPMLRAEEVWGDIRPAETKAKADAVETEGVLRISLLYHCEEDETPLCILERGIPFGQMMELRGVEEGDSAAVQLRLDDLDFQMLSEQEGELRATVTMEAVVTRTETAEIVKDLTLEEETERPATAGAVIYVVQPQDTLWKIAKRYRTTVEDILSVNEIENPDLIYPGQKLLIIKQIH